MTQSKHTPTPWHYEGGYSIYKIGETCHEIASASPTATENENMEANAEFIFRACNAHNDLVAALESAVFELDQDGRTNTDDFKTLIAKAKAQS